MNLLQKLKEAALSVLPISILVIILGLTLGDFSAEVVWRFVISCVFVMVGIALFSLGADMAMMPIGQVVGSTVTKSRKIWLIVLISLVIGIIITIAEPDLTVLASRLDPTINKWLLIIVVAVGVGVFLVVAMLRIIFHISLRWLLIGFYAAAFIMAAFVGENFVPLAFDSGGITTGPMTVPFIMALGLGVAALNGSGDTDDSFGLVALCSIGPIIVVLILGLFTDTANLTLTAIAEHSDQGIFMPFLTQLPVQFKNVAIALAPICVFFLLFRAVAVKNMAKTEFWRIIIGLIYTYIGLVIFLTAVEVGFQNAGELLGKGIATVSKWILIPIGAVVGFMIVAVEPAVQILITQVEQISGGTIRKRSILISLMCGVSASVGIAMLRVATGISIWWFVLPLYAIGLGLSFVVPKTFTAIAFDSGGIASGPMTATFLLSFAIGACETLGGNVLTDSFGLVAMVAVAPIPAVQIFGLIATVKQKRAKRAIMEQAAAGVGDTPITAVTATEELTAFTTDTAITADTLAQDTAKPDNVKPDNVKPDNEIIEL